jgi:drug/metabolite transporter (DMT)-like permease
MTLGVFLAVMCAAVLHAGWNALIKTGVNKQTSMLVMTVCQAGIGAAIVVFRPWPVTEAWPWLLGSGLIHMFYQLFLAYAYEQGDLSRVYPLARGSAPLIVLLVSAAFLSDTISAMEYVGVAVLGLGIVMMARGAFTSGESRRLIPFALGSACATAGYTLVDGVGARISGDPFTFVSWLLIMAAVTYVPAVLALKGRSVAIAPVRVWCLGAAAAAASFAAYAIAVWAMTVAPLALVAALRETSILFAVLIGWAFFGDRMDRGKVMAAGLIVFGVVLTRL